MTPRTEEAIAALDRRTHRLSVWLSEFFAGIGLHLFSGLQQAMSQQPPKTGSGALVWVCRRRCEIDRSPAEKCQGKAYDQDGSNLGFSVHRIIEPSSFRE
jgi:hypothetical protein